MKKELIDYVDKHSKNREKNLKYDFMPNILEIIEKPAHIGGKVIIYTIFLLIISIFIWAALSRTDVTITSNGTVSPVGEVNIVQSSAAGIVKEICVSDGQYVEEGKLLFKLDTQENTLNIDSLKNNINLLEKENELYLKLINSESITDSDIESYDSDIQTEIKYIVNNEDIFQDKIKSYNETTKESTQKQHIVEILESYNSNKSKIKDYKLQLDIAQDNELKKNINATTNGYVSNLQVYSMGAVVNSGQKLLEIIPENSELQMECKVLNKDIADIKVGQSVEVKFDAYPYSDYGTIKENITYISANATLDEKLGYVYIIRVSIRNSSSINVISGMTGNCEIKTGKRTLLKYFMDPIINGVDKSFKEK